MGANYGTVTNSHVTGNVSGDTYVGGLVGINPNVITKSYATGNVTGTNFDTGRLVGHNKFSGSIDNS